MKFKPLDHEGSRYTCRNAKVWPPSHALLEDSFQLLRDNKEITELEYERLRTWERVCGLTEMKASKCMTCPHLLNEEGVAINTGPPTPLPYATKHHK